MHIHSVSLCWRAVAAALGFALAGCGGGDDDSGTPPDTTPDAFQFTDVTDAESGRFYESAITVAGLGADVSITAKLGEITASGFEVFVNGVRQDNHNGFRVRNGDDVRVRLVAGEAIGDAVGATLTLSGGDEVSDRFDVTTVDAEGPQIGVHFPPPVSITRGERIHVRGVVSDQSAIASFKVGSRDSIIGADGMWSAEVELVAGPNAIDIVATDVAGNTRTATVSVDTTAGSTGTPIPGLGNIDYDSMSKTVVGTQFFGEVAAMTVDVGEAIISEPIGSSNGLRGIAIDDENQRAFVMAETADAIYELDLVSGETAVLSSNAGQGAGPLWDALDGAAYAAASGQLFAIDNGANTIVSVNPVNGDRALVAADGLEFVEDIATNPAGTMLFVTDFINDVISMVDVATGETTIISDGAGCGGISDMRGIAFDTNDERHVYSISNAGRHVFAVELGTGSCHVVSGDIEGAGAALEDPVALTYDADRRMLYVVDYASGGTALFAVDVLSGDRVIVFK